MCLCIPATTTHTLTAPPLPWPPLDHCHSLFPGPPAPALAPMPTARPSPSAVASKIDPICHAAWSKQTNKQKLKKQTTKNPVSSDLDKPQNIFKMSEQSYTSLNGRVTCFGLILLWITMINSEQYIF